MKKPVKITLIVVAILAILGGVFAILYFKTDLFNGLKKPKAVFHEYLDKVTAMDDNDIKYEDVIAKIKDIKNNSFEMNATVSAEVELGSALSAYQSYADILKKLEFGFDSKVNISSKAGEITINVKYDGEDLGTIDAIINEDKIGFKIDEITDKYYTISMDEIKTIGESAVDSATGSLDGSYVDLDVAKSTLEKFNLSSIDDLISIMEIKDSEISRITKKYTDVIKDTVSDDNYSSSKEKITVNGKELNANAYTLKITDKDLIKIAKNVLKALKDDTDTLNLVVEKANKVMTVMQQSTKLSKSNLTELLDAAIAGFDGVNEIPMLNGKTISITLYENGNNVVRTELKLGNDAIIIDSVENGDTTNGAVKVKIKGEEMTLFTTEITKKGDDKYTAKLSTDLKGVKAEITSDIDGDKTNTKLVLEVEGMGKVTLNVNSEVNFKNVNIEKLTGSNSKSLRAITEAEKTEISTNATKFLTKHQELLTSLAGSFSSMSSNQTGNLLGREENVTETDDLDDSDELDDLDDLEDVG